MKPALDVMFLFFLSAATPWAWPDCSAQADAHLPYNGTLGPFGAPARFNATWDSKPLVVLRPAQQPPTAAGYPLVRPARFDFALSRASCLLTDQGFHMSSHHGTL